LTINFYYFQNVTQSDYNSEIIISPLSIDMALTVLLIGSSGITFKQMLAGLKYPSNYSINLVQSNSFMLVKAVGKAGGVSMGEIRKFVH
jgi:serine protease inhibitor